ncbi:selenoprotein S-like isoform X2 [Danaus plexippus]|uniref:selenoprotein S-like isoform X2 n=1 Tax=Danaus plexippus TaxID=13037 RepID=UPI002AB167EA|nr:selenoprotein S-like isoform X2 [Danaus plexippus]XP_061385218.1 selenoprotein S-like isoform X2 [Danaus plexippus]
MDPLVEEQETTMFNPITLSFLSSYGWYIVGASALIMYATTKLRPRLDKWRESQEDAKYHKDSDLGAARRRAEQEAREKQQRALEEASRRAAEEKTLREERKRAEALERLQKYGSDLGAGRTLRDDDFLPLSGGASTSSYRAPKRSACSRGGCGR